MIEASCEVLQQGSVEKYTFFEADSSVSYSRFFAELATSSEFRLWFCELLKSSSLREVAFETPCVGTSNLNQPFQFVLVSNPALGRLEPDPYTFEEHFNGRSLSASFINLSRDALLVVPKPSGDTLDYSHLMAFIRNAPTEQLDDYWTLAGQEILKRIAEKPQWISTAGLGVYWLHLRISNVPKYYRYEPFIKPI